MPLKAILAALHSAELVRAVAPPVAAGLLAWFGGVFSERRKIGSARHNIYRELMNNYNMVYRYATPSGNLASLNQLGFSPLYISTLYFDYLCRDGDKFVHIHGQPAIAALYQNLKVLQDGQVPSPVHLINLMTALAVSYSSGSLDKRMVKKFATPELHRTLNSAPDVRAKAVH